MTNKVEVLSFGIFLGKVLEKLDTVKRRRAILKIKEVDELYREHVEPHSGPNSPRLSLQLIRIERNKKVCCPKRNKYVPTNYADAFFEFLISMPRIHRPGAVKSLYEIVHSFLEDEK